MPWNIVKDARCPSDRPWAVVGGQSGSHLAGCHPDETSARAQQKALYASDANRLPGWADQMVAPSPRISLVP